MMKKNITHSLMAACSILALWGILSGGCRQDSSISPDTHTVLPVKPIVESGTGSGAHLMNFWSERNSSEQTGVLAQPGLFKLRTASGSYQLTYSTTLGQFHLIFHASAPSIINIGLHSGDVVKDAVLQTGDIQPCDHFSPWENGPVRLYSWPGSGMSCDTIQVFTASSNAPVELIRNGQLMSDIAILSEPSSTPQQPSATPPGNPSTPTPQNPTPVPTPQNPTPVPTPSTCAAGGVQYGGYCWYYGAESQSCTATCNQKGLTCNETGTAWAGSNAPDGDRCSGVMQALGRTDSYPGVASGMDCFGDAIGCFQTTGDIDLCALPATVCDGHSQSANRACVCQ